MLVYLMDASQSVVCFLNLAVATADHLVLLARHDVHLHHDALQHHDVLQYGVVLPHPVVPL